MTTKRTYGLLLSRRFEHGTEYVEVSLISREDENEYPKGVSSLYTWELPKPLAGCEFDGLGMYGFVSEANDNQYIGYEAEYRGVYAVDESRARRMAKTLNRVNNRIQKDRAHDPGDKLVAIARALKLDFVVERVGKRIGSSYADMDWRWMTVEEGRNRYRELIATAIAEVKEGKAA